MPVFTITSDITIDELEEAMFDALDNSDMMQIIIDIDDRIAEYDFSMGLIRALMKPLESEGCKFTIEGLTSEDQYKTPENDGSTL